MRPPTPISALPTWTPTEDATLRSSYASDGAEFAARATGRSRSAVFHRARRLGLSRRRRWSPGDDATLRALWGVGSVAAIARRIGRTAATTYWRARKLGLECGAPQGTEYLYAAAQRTGYSTGQLWRILRAAGVLPARTMSRPTKASRGYHAVEPIDVDEAVSRWHASEALEPAARARGMIGATLASTLRLARAAGFPVPAEPKRAKAHWRIPSTVIDEVLAWRAGLESVSASALRVGVTRQTLTVWLVAAKVPRHGMKPWLVERSEVDRVVAERASSRAVVRRSA